jgi:hypothetical protein
LIGQRELVLPLRVIRSDREHQDTVRVLSSLVGRQNAKLSDGARQYADTLARFIQDYDQRKYPMLATKLHWRSSGT